MTSSDSQRREIRQRMEALRNNIRLEWRGTTREAKELVNWKTHVRRHPGVAVGIAALAGFLVAPRLRRKRGGGVVADPSLRVAAGPQPSPETKSRRAGFVAAGVRLAAGYVARQLFRRLSAELINGWQAYSGPVPQQPARRRHRRGQPNGWSTPRFHSRN